MNMGGNRKTSAQRKFDKEQRLAFLRAYPGLADLPSETMDVTDERSAALDTCIEAMKARGLYSYKSERQDIRWGVRVLVGLVRQELDPR